MTFTEALAVLLRGGKVRRKGWANSFYHLGFSADDSLVADGDWPELYRDDIEATDWEEVTG